MSEIFPPEIVTRILTRLPVKSVTRFKCVSKKWHSLITTPKFITAYISAHTSASSPPPWLILERNITLSPTESNLHSSPTHLQLAPLPNVSTLSIKPQILSPPDSPFIFDKQTYPAAVLQSSNGFLLCSLHTEHDPLKESRKYPSPFDSYFPPDYTDQQSLVIVNPLTKEWARIPQSIHPVDMMMCVALTTRLDPENPGVVEKFVVAEYQHIVKDNSAVMMCFSSDTCRWVAKRTEHVLGSHPFRPNSALEFQGKLFWTFLSAGLIIWEDDPFTASETEDKAQCRLIPLPPGCSLPIAECDTALTRTIGVSGDHIHFLELRFNDRNISKWSDLVKLWRLKDTKTGVWSVMYKVKTVDYLEYMGFLKLASIAIWFSHPYKEDTAVFQAKGYVLFYNLRTGKAEALAKIDGEADFFLYKLPLWPTSLPLRFWKTLDAEYNQCGVGEVMTKVSGMGV